MSNQNISYNEYRQIPIAREISYDLIVYGAGPEGISAATVAGEKGLKVLLLEERPAIGGLLTEGGLNFIDMNYDADGILVTQGFFKRFYDAVGGNAFELKKAKEVFKTFLLDADVDLETDCALTDIVLKDGKIQAIITEKNGESKEYTSRFFIDASPDGKLAAKAGVPFSIFGEDIKKAKRLMGVTLVFELENVNWTKVFLYLNYSRLKGKKENDERQFYGAKLKTAWGYSIEGYSYVPEDKNMRLRGLNAARQDDGKVLINALIIFDVNPLDPASKNLAFERAAKELEYVIPYLQEKFPGFERAELIGTAEDLYVRESRHFITDYVLSIDDVLENRSFEDQIAIGSYPVDLQPSGPEDFGTVVGDPDKYGIPYRSLLSKEVSNLLLAGKHAGYSSLAAGSTRVIPVGMVTAEAAALATCVAMEEGTDFQEIKENKSLMDYLQRKITDNGGYIEEFFIENLISDHPAYKQMKKLRSMGLVAGGYHNEYYFSEIIDKWKFDHILRGILEYNGRVEDYQEIDLYPTFGSIGKLIYQLEHGEEGKVEEIRDFLRDSGISENLEDKLKKYSEQPMVGDVYILLGNYSEYLASKE